MNVRLKNILVTIGWTIVSQIVLWGIILCIGGCYCHYVLGSSLEAFHRFGFICGILITPVLILTFGLCGFLATKGKLPGSRKDPKPGAL